MKSKRKFSFWIGIGLGLMVGVASWSIYSMMNQGMSDILSKFGLYNVYFQNLAIVLLVLIILLILKTPFKKAIMRLAK